MEPVSPLERLSRVVGPQGRLREGPGLLTPEAAPPARGIPAGREDMFGAPKTCGEAMRDGILGIPAGLDEILGAL